MIVVRLSIIPVGFLKGQADLRFAADCAPVSNKRLHARFKPAQKETDDHEENNLC